MGERTGGVDGKVAIAAEAGSAPGTGVGIGTAMPPMPTHHRRAVREL